MGELDEASVGLSRREIIRRSLKIGSVAYIAPVVLASARTVAAAAQITPVPFAQCAVSGQAFGAQVGGTVATLAPVGLVTLPPGGTQTVLSTGLPNLFTTGVITNTSTNISTATQSSASSSSTVNGLNLGALGLLGISATTLRTVSTSTSNRVTASSSAAGTTFEGLVINGTPIVINPAPNTVIPLPGVGSVVINEQILTGNGTTQSSLTVNALRIIIAVAVPLLGLPVGAEIIIASSTSAVNCA